MEYETKEELRVRFKRVKDRVEWLLINKPQTRGDDRILYLEYFKTFQPVFVYNPFQKTITFSHPLTYEEWRSMTSFETIRRARQKLQENGDYQPLPDTVLKRIEREENFREILIESGGNLV
ncbi:MAG: hypothetical protein QXP04_03895 [Candidatus Nanoarchaeia archaeon]|nr:hypothetical protein [Candidatus Jingweiarchaeum tengchongense]